MKGFSHCDPARSANDSHQVHIDKYSPIEEMILFAYLWDIVGGHKYSAMFAGNRMLTKEQTAAVLNWLRCYANAEYFPNKKDYCCIQPGVTNLHGWGCKWLHSVIRHGQFGGHSGIHWYKIGPFDGNIQYIDKQDIKDKLAAEASAKCLDMCPMFSLQRAFKYVDELPDHIDPVIDADWEFQISEEPESRGERTGVQPAEVGILYKSDEDE